MREFGSADDVVMRLATERQLLDVIQRQQMKLSGSVFVYRNGSCRGAHRSCDGRERSDRHFRDYDADGITETVSLVRFFAGAALIRSYICCTACAKATA